MEPIILNKLFQGPYLNCENLQNKPGVYMVVCDSFGISPLRVLNAGDAEDVKEKLTAKKKINFLKKSNVENLKYLICYERSSANRLKLVKEIKKYFFPSI